MKKKGIAAGKGDEGAWAPQIDDALAFELIAEATGRVADEMNVQVDMGIDVAASQMWNGEGYKYRDRVRSTEDQIAYIAELVDKYNLVYVEDPLHEDDFDAFAELNGRIGDRCLLCGDDLFVTQVARIETGIERGSANCVLIKPNQVGTLTDTFEAVRLAHTHDHTLDSVDRWIRMVATNRLTGHSSGFFSVYTLPPNQAVSPQSQQRINKRRGQMPEYRDTHALIQKKTMSLIAGLTPARQADLNRAGAGALFLTGDARATPGIMSGTVQLTVTSPPFLDIVQYREDNWLRCWFCGLDAGEIGRKITMARTVPEWEDVMGAVFQELYRITAPGGRVAFEVGEVRKKTVRLEEHVVPLGCAAGFSCEGVIINQQAFTKTSNIWGIGNNEYGTNTNRIVVFSKPPS